jgi:hypothetical protein
LSGQAIYFVGESERTNVVISTGFTTISGQPIRCIAIADNTHPLQKDEQGLQ